jgi:hypothetical protein
VILLGLLCALAVIESIAAFLEYRERIGEEDWEAVSAVLAQRSSEPNEPVIVASEWLGPSARMRLPQTRTWGALAYPDLRSFGRFWVLTHKRERPWRGPLRAELEGMPRPQLLSVHDAGELTLQEYTQRVGIERFSLIESVPTIDTARGRCRGSGDQWKCKDGSVSLRTVEIDYRPRRGVLSPVVTGHTTEHVYEGVPGGHLVGYVGLHDYYARKNGEGVVVFRTQVDDQASVSLPLHSSDGWRRFELDLGEGTHKVRFSISAERPAFRLPGFHAEVRGP